MTEPKSKILQRLEAFKTNTGVYGANTSQAEQVLATERRKAARYAEAVLTIQKCTGRIELATETMMSTIVKRDLEQALKDPATYQATVEVLEKAAAAVAEFQGVVLGMGAKT